MKLAVIGCSGVSTGELTLVLDWARRLERDVDLHLIVSEQIAPSLAWTNATIHPFVLRGGSAGALSIERSLAAIEPDAVLIADLLLCYLTSPEFGRVFRGANLLAAVVARATTRYPVIALDLYDWDENASAIDLAGSTDQSLATAVPPAVGRLMPSPYLRPEPSTPGRGRYAMMDLAATPSKKQRAAVRKHLGLTGTVVLTTTSPWQHLFSANPAAAGVTAALPPLMLSLLDEAASKRAVTLVHLGPAPISPLPRLKATTYRHVPQLPPDQFLPLLSSVDLVLAPNAIATTNIRAASMGIPVATLEVGRGPLRGHPALETYAKAAQPPYPFRVWPLGFYDLMQGVLRDNPFATIQQALDACEPAACVEGLADLLTGKAAKRLGEAQRDYFETLSTRIDSAEEALVQALKS